MLLLQFETKKGKFALLKVPYKGRAYSSQTGQAYTTVWCATSKRPVVKDHYILSGKWTYIEEAFSPTIDLVLKKVVPVNIFGSVYFEGRKYKDRLDAWRNGYLPSLKVYNENPIGPDPCTHDRNCYESCQGSCWPEDMDFADWEEAELRTGTWLLLKQL